MRNFERLGVAAALAALVIVGFAPWAASQPAKTAKPPPGLQEEFDGFIVKFRTALKSNDATAVGGMTKLPFFHDHRMIEAAEFRSRAYPAYFTANARSCLQRSRSVYDRDGENNHNYFIFCGQRIFVFTKTATGFLFSGVDVND